MGPDAKWIFLKNRLDRLSHFDKNEFQDIDAPEIYSLFQKQTNLFLTALEEIQPPIRLVVDGRHVNPANPGNWFTAFSPISWGRKTSNGASGPGSGYGSGVGIAYVFYYTKSINGDHYVRLSSGVESPFKKEFREAFKNDISIAISSRNTPLPEGCRVWPDAKFPDFRFRGTALIECQPVQLGDNSWENALFNYLILNKEYNNLVAQLLRTYYEKRAFSVELDFEC